MIFTETALPGAWLVDLEPRGDERGFFARAWCRREFEARGLAGDFVQVNTSYNHRRGTLRGMHLQHPPHAEVKLIRCLRGAIHDVIVDVRPGSATRGRWLGVELSAANRRALYVPEGFAHGFVTLEDETEVLYQVTAFYAPGAEDGLRFDDPAIGIEWPVPIEVVSPKDREWPDFGARLERRA